MKNAKSKATPEKNPQQLFEEIQNEDIRGISFDEIRKRLRIVHNAMDYTLNRQSEILDRMSDSFQMIA